MQRAGIGGHRAHVRLWRVGPLNPIPGSHTLLAPRSSCVLALQRPQRVGSSVLAPRGRSKDTHRKGRPEIVPRRPRLGATARRRLLAALAHDRDVRRRRVRQPARSTRLRPRAGTSEATRGRRDRLPDRRVRRRAHGCAPRDEGGRAATQEGNAREATGRGTSDESAERAAGSSTPPAGGVACPSGMLNAQEAFGLISVLEDSRREGRCLRPTSRIMWPRLQREELCGGSDVT